MQTMFAASMRKTLFASARREALRFTTIKARLGVHALCSFATDTPRLVLVRTEQEQSPLKAKDFLPLFYRSNQQPPHVDAVTSRVDVRCQK